MKTKYLFLILSLFLLTYSCNKNDDEPIEEETPVADPLPEAPSGTAWQSSTIDPNEIKGEDLTVLTSYNEDSEISNNNFTTIVSQEGTQIIFVLDKNNSIKGLSYTIKNGDKYEIEKVNAVSTINSLFLLTPGMTTTSPSETTELINKLKSLSSYGQLKNAIQNNLSDNNLTEILAKDNVKTLYENVVLEYLEQLSKDNETKSAQIDLYGNRLSVMKNADGKPEISNGAFRRINVYRSYLDGNNVNDTELIFESMNGGVGVSWGSLFTLSSFQPTVNADEAYLPPTQSTETEYWIIGPGQAESSEIPPSYIDKDYDQTLTETCIYYVLFPMLDLLNGTSQLINKEGLVKTFLESTKEVRTGTKGLKYLDGMKDATSKAAFSRELINFSVLIGKSAIAIPSIASAIGLSSGVAGTIGTCLTIISIPMSAANISVFTVDYFKQPKYSKFIIETQLNPPVLLSPANGSQNVSPSVTFSWQKNPLAWNYYIEVSKNSDFSNATKKTTDGITTSLTLDLEPSMAYYWRVYCAKGNGAPSDWSDVWSFTTNSGYSLPVVSTNPASDITGSTAKLNGTINTNGGTTITEKGFYWSSTNQTPSDNDNIKVVNGTNETYSYSLTGLDPKTTYYYRAYAKNSQGTGIAENVESFVTTEIPSENLVNLILPENNALLDNGCYGQSNKITWYFDWNDFPNAEQYHLYVIGPNAKNPVIDKDIVESEYKDESDGYIANKNRLNWTWKVRAMVDGVWTDWSETRTFDVEPLNTDCN